MPCQNTGLCTRPPTLPPTPTCSAPFIVRRSLAKGDRCAVPSRALHQLAKVVIRRAPCTFHPSILIAPSSGEDVQSPLLLPAPWSTSSTLPRMVLLPRRARPFILTPTSILPPRSAFRLASPRLASHKAPSFALLCLPCGTFSADANANAHAHAHAHAATPRRRRPGAHPSAFWCSYTKASLPPALSTLTLPGGSIYASAGHGPFLLR
ncbi:uncharacterized protein MYCFIDRAFT_209986 [Pseudocercospora fijiensis CIRAD86]|uniref:Uncharacterized protein n=1 Tax=Pseudocercospora fijiensis (strain CIRAD86) TaxID=383855 RepID=N1QCA7_PSEFD|nr:uncharacterized protein MYCFIDRAFT_209986 [Pseudocercospora fijiensis CIRAD86]EME89097.1 hypothetical protein MYCFIDRAFT_209986 [Pseudocercospora fijiensis CIRAD86]